MLRAYTWTFFGGHLEKMHGTDLTLNCRPKNSLDLESAQNLALKKHRFKKMSMICPTLFIVTMQSNESKIDRNTYFS